ncbi:hypothetical protein PVAP13_2KG142216 [Panicum virgatum]|uniref:Uncharacterized protein n=2 Tax=Panicum virgatum TaxID=38727 RepID=A0A8T0W8Q8_PANVG|nr:hypothetical protein PVAP13_2KG142216 [Panicum virgatum]
MDPPAAAAAAAAAEAEEDLLEVRCPGCGETLEVERGLAEFACPDCATPQALPPELMPPPPPPRRRRALPLTPSAPASARLPCGSCGAMLGVPPGLARCGCPVCGAELAVAPARLRRYLLSVATAPLVPVSLPPVFRALEVREQATRSCRPRGMATLLCLHLLSRPNKIGSLRTECWSVAFAPPIL